MFSYFTIGFCSALAPCGVFVVVALVKHSFAISISEQ